MSPQAVFDELTVNERFRLEADEIRQKKFIVVKPVNNPESASILKERQVLTRARVKRLSCQMN